MNSLFWGILFSRMWPRFTLQISRFTQLWHWTFHKVSLYLIYWTWHFIFLMQDKVTKILRKGIQALLKDGDERSRHYKAGTKRRKGQILTPKVKMNRLTIAKKFLNKLRHPVEAAMICFFSNEKSFCQDKLHNTQNMWLAYNPHSVPRIMKTKFSQTMMMLYTYEYLWILMGMSHSS